MLTLTDILIDAGRQLNAAFIDELVQQGHHLTGALEGSIKGTIRISKRGDGTLTGTILGYGHILDQGVSRDRIPYGGTATGAKSSAYIQALIGYFKKRGLSDKEAKGAAFATARKHKQEGMPTANSYRYSFNHRRLNFIEQVDLDISPTLQSVVFTGMDQMIDETYHLTPSETI